AETVETTQAIAVRRDPLTERAPQTAPSQPAIERRAQVERHQVESHEVERQATPLFDGPLILVVVLLALVAVGIVMTRRPAVRPQSALRRDVGFEIPAADGRGEAPSAWKACASAACFTAVAVMVYLGSQSPASVRGMLGYFGLSD